MLKNSLPPLLTRILFSMPLVMVSGSLLLETHFGIPASEKSLSMRSATGPAGAHGQ
jgi:peptide/nickel transport system permease protein